MDDFTLFVNTSQRTHFPQLSEALQTQLPAGTRQAMQAREEEGGQAIRSGGDCGKLRAQTLPEVAAVAELQTPISGGEHRPGVARSPEFIKSDRISGFYVKWPIFKTLWVRRICLQPLRSLD